MLKGNSVFSSGMKICWMSVTPFRYAIAKISELTLSSTSSKVCSLTKWYSLKFFDVLNKRTAYITIDYILNCELVRDQIEIVSI